MTNDQIQLQVQSCCKLLPFWPFFWVIQIFRERMKLFYCLIKQKIAKNSKCKNPSLNTQSCIRRPLCSTFRFENLSFSPKKTCFFNFFKEEVNLYPAPRAFHEWFC